MISTNLISIQKFYADNNVFLEFHSSFFVVKNLSSKKVLLQGLTNHGLYKFPQKSLQSSTTNSRVSYFSSDITSLPINNALLWHNRLGYLALPIVNKVLSVSSLPVVCSCDFCVSYQLAKSHILSFLQLTSHVIKSFELVHSNLWGLSPINSVNGVEYFLLVIDDCTRFSWMYLLNSKYETTKYFLQFKTIVETQFNTKILTFQFDWGGEYRPISTLLSHLGILHHLSYHSNPIQNGRGEYKNRHMVKVGLSLLAHAFMPLKY